MTGALSDALAELIAMRAANEITPEEFAAARERLRNRHSDDPGTPTRHSVEGEDITAFQSFSNRSIAGAASASPPSKTSKKPKRLRVVLGIVAAVFLAIIVIGSLVGGTTYKSTEYGAAWPYPEHDKATVRCEMKKFGSTDRPLVTIELGGKTYGLNSAALGVGGYPDSRTLEGPDSSAYAATKQKMIDEALRRECR